ncbi:MAG: lysylphosphatidylglycerol synthase domain-containing protein [Thermodesulfobacteriota bacterium]|nr:lysylphosphatidylglycerol synthase domain-containing protein [Thermodesulfobacteriota bacterium]
MLYLLAGLSAFILFCYVFDSYKVLPYLDETNLGFVSLCLGLTFIHLYIVRSLFFMFLFRRSGTNISFYSTMRVLTGANFSALFASGRLNEPIYVFLFHKKTKLPISQLVTFVVFERCLYVLLAAVFLAASVFQKPSFAEQILRKVSDNIALNTNPLYIAAAACILGCLFWVTWRMFRSHFIIFLSDFKSIISSPILIGGSLGIYGFNFFVIFTYNLLLFQVLSQNILFFDWDSFVFAVFVTSTSIIVGAVSILPIGVGPGEFTFAALLVSAGLSPEISSAFVLFSVFFYFTTVITTFIGVSWGRKIRQRPVLTKATNNEVGAIRG